MFCFVFVDAQHVRRVVMVATCSVRNLSMHGYAQNRTVNLRQHNPQALHGKQTVPVSSWFEHDTESALPNIAVQDSSHSLTSAGLQAARPIVAEDAS